MGFTDLVSEAGLTGKSWLLSFSLIFPLDRSISTPLFGQEMENLEINNADFFLSPQQLPDHPLLHRWVRIQSPIFSFISLPYPSVAVHDSSGDSSFPSL